MSLSSWTEENWDWMLCRGKRTWPYTVGENCYRRDDGYVIARLYSVYCPAIMEGLNRRGAMAKIGIFRPTGRKALLIRVDDRGFPVMRSKL